jgi:threonine/homoserine/homoserine lactone efflux protein
MLDWLPSRPLLTTFLVASLVLAVTPGPGVLYIVARSLLQGRRVALASVAGVALGNLGNAFGAAAGLAALLAVSSLAFSALKYAGAVYLLYLGLRALRAFPPDTPAARPDAVGLRRAFRDGFVVALLNPKTAVFFAAFLPQFMSAAAPALPQAFLLGALFVAIASVTDTIYALGASAVSRPLSRARGIRPGGRYLTGGALIGLGVYTALSGSRDGAG